jgi:hypothetical protein
MEFVLFGYDVEHSLESVKENVSIKYITSIIRVEEKAKQEISMKAGVKARSTIVFTVTGRQMSLSDYLVFSILGNSTT